MTETGTNIDAIFLLVHCKVARLQQTEISVFTNRSDGGPHSSHVFFQQQKMKMNKVSRKVE